MRMVSVALVVVVAPVVTPPQTQPVVVPTVLIVVILSGWYAWWLVRGAGVIGTLADGAVLSCAALGTPWLVPASWLAQGRSWLVPFVALACVGYQYTTRAWVGVPLAAVVITALYVGTAAAPNASGNALFSAWWSMVIAMLARLLWWQVERGASLADETLAGAERVRESRRAARAVRGDDRRLARTLHDTSATTLLMVGAGEVEDGAVLRRRAQRDLGALQSFGSAPPAECDLCQLLRRDQEMVELDLVVHGPDRLVLPGGVATAFADAAREALHNISRHAGTAAAKVTVTVRDRDVTVVIEDDGIGFAPDDGVGSGRGLTLSICRRMSEIGGQAQIASSPGCGTCIVLRWTSERT